MIRNWQRAKRTLSEKKFRKFLDEEGALLRGEGDVNAIENPPPNPHGRKTGNGYHWNDDDR